MANPTVAALSPVARQAPLIGFVARVPLIAGSAVAILGAVVLAGWGLNLPAITTSSAQGYPMLPLTALCFVLSGGSLTMAGRQHRPSAAEAGQQTLAAVGAAIAGRTPF